MKKIFLILSASVCLCGIVFSQNWQSFGDFGGSTVSAYSCLYADQETNILYIGGSDVNENGTPYSGIVAYDGINFSGLGNNTTCLHSFPNNDLSAVVFCATNYNNDLYVGGSFSYADTIVVNNIARWDGSKWHPLGQGTTGSVRILSVIDDTLYVGGNIHSIVGVDSVYNGIAKWDGTNWHTISNIGLPGSMTVEAIVEYKDEIYIGGNFGNFTDTINEVARWDGTQWLSLTAGILGDSWVDAMVVYQGYLYVGGYFYEQDGNAGNCIMRWDGETWSDVGGGLQGITTTGNAQVHDLCVYNNELWVGGVHSYAGGIPAKRIAKWDGQKWCGIVTNIDNRVKRFAVYNDMMYVAGGFDTIGNMHIPYIAKWTGGSYVDSCSSPTNGAEIISPEGDLIIYPNPANNILNITHSNTDIQSIEIFNQTGQLIKQVPENSNQLNISGLSIGTYILRLVGKDTVWTEKFVIIR